MLSDIWKGAFDAARAMRAQYQDAEDCASNTVLAAIRAGSAIDNPRAYGRRCVHKRALSRPTYEGLDESIPDRSVDLSALREALVRTGADRWSKARGPERATIRARLAREGWGS